MVTHMKIGACSYCCIRHCIAINSCGKSMYQSGCMLSVGTISLEDRFSGSMLSVGAISLEDRFSGSMLSVGAISLEDRFSGSKKSGIGGGGWVSAQDAMHMKAALAACRTALVGTG